LKIKKLLSVVGVYNTNPITGKIEIFKYSDDGNTMERIILDDESKETLLGIRNQLEDVLEGEVELTGETIEKLEKQTVIEESQPIEKWVEVV
jgi:predicted ABC-type transport system involved in lysophospholipase L1 biosynthesis ATPase subunit